MKATFFLTAHYVNTQENLVKQMIEDDRYCDDVLTQMLAVNKALESLENVILEKHLERCITKQIKEGNTEVTEEIMNLFKKMR